MAKGTIRITAGVPTPVTLSTTVSYDRQVLDSPPIDYTGTTPVGGNITGTITDLVTNKVIPFEQPFGMEMGLVDGMTVNYETVTIAGQVIANSVRIFERGVIQTINATNDGGTLKDKAYNVVIPFSQLYCKESGLVAPSQGVKGSVVTFERIIDPKTGVYSATSIQLK